MSELLRLTADSIVPICLAAATMEALGPDERTVAPFQAICALATAICILRGALRFLE